MVTPELSGLAQVTGGYDLLPKEKVVLDPSDGERYALKLWHASPFAGTACRRLWRSP